MSDDPSARRDAAPRRTALSPASAAGLPATPAARPSCSADAMPCDRCGVEMFRMHAVWRCPACGYKTDCCGW
jgi:hypothetical protein